MTVENAAAFGIRQTFTVVACAMLVTVSIALWPTRSTAILAVAVSVAALLWLSHRQFWCLLFAVFFLVAWFPEFSQTQWDVWTA